MPARFRKSLSAESDETFVISFAADNRLRAYPLDEWAHIEARYAKLKPTPKNTKFLRRMYQTMSESTLDSQGRITLTPQQLAYAEIDKKVSLVGFPSERCIEICAPDNLIEDDDDEDFSALFYGAMGDDDDE